MTTPVKLPVLREADKPQEHCGVIAVFDPHGLAAQLVRRGLSALQHRGQEAAGITLSHSDRSQQSLRGRGLVSQVLPVEKVAPLSAQKAIGHVRYSTVAIDHKDNVQPISVPTPYGAVALAHNGNLLQVQPLREQLIAQGCEFATTMDSEVLLQLVAHSTEPDFVTALAQAARSVRGAYSLGLLCDDKIYGLRDPIGLRPLVLGSFPTGGFAIASETCALTAIGARYLGEVLPGELVELHADGITRTQLLPPSQNVAPCVFELIYFSRPDSVVFGQSAQQARLAMGKALAEQDEDLPPADLVIPVPDSGIAAAIGYARHSGIPFELALVRSHFVGRSFILPNQAERLSALERKLSVIEASVSGKRVVVVDDSLVRGNTARTIVKLLREGGAKEVWLRLASPPIAWPCDLGIDMATQEELLYRRADPDLTQLQRDEAALERVRSFIEADNLRYLSLAGLRRSVSHKSLCFGCMTGSYPT
jgi:amidophosphoribosyltransferase